MTSYNGKIHLSIIDFYLGHSKSTNELIITNDPSKFDNGGKITLNEFKTYISDMKTDKTNTTSISDATIKTEITVVKNIKSNIKGYKLKYYEYNDAINKILGFSLNINGFEKDKTAFPDTYNKLNKAGVLDIWFEPVYEIKEITGYFGDVKFTLKKGNDYLETEFGNILMSEIKRAVDYIENPPRINGYSLTIHSGIGDDMKYTSISYLDDSNQNISIGFGCKYGKLKELKLIYNAYCDLNNIDIEYL